MTLKQIIMSQTLSDVALLSVAATTEKPVTQERRKNLALRGRQVPP